MTEGISTSVSPWWLLVFLVGIFGIIWAVAQYLSRKGY